MQCDCFCAPFIVWAHMKCRLLNMSSSTIRDRVGMKGQRDRSRLRSLVYRVKLVTCIFMLLITSVLIIRAYHHESPTTPTIPLRRYTVLINTWNRHDLLRKSVAHYASCSGVKAIRVVWSESDTTAESLQSSLLKSVEKFQEIELRFDIHKEDNLNNRFKPMEGITTDAIFSIDDDVLVPCSSLEFAFTVWLSAPESMVGFVPRMHWLNSKSNTYSRQYSYGGWWSVWWMGTYSMVLSKAAFLHHKYFDYYTYSMPASIREYVSNHRNCEDIAMSFLVANVTGGPPIWVRGKLYEIGASGISSLKGHNHHRSVCVNYFASLYGYMPLVATNVKAMNAHNEWFW